MSGHPPKWGNKSKDRTDERPQPLSYNSFLTLDSFEKTTAFYQNIFGNSLKIFLQVNPTENHSSSSTKKSMKHCPFFFGLQGFRIFSFEKRSPRSYQHRGTQSIILLSVRQSHFAVQWLRWTDRIYGLFNALPTDSRYEVMRPQPGTPATKDCTQVYCMSHMQSKINRIVPK